MSHLFTEFIFMNDAWLQQSQVCCWGNRWSQITEEDHALPQTNHDSFSDDTETLKILAEAKIATYDRLYIFWLNLTI